MTDQEAEILRVLSFWDRALAERYRRHLETGKPLGPADAEIVGRLLPEPPSWW